MNADEFYRPDALQTVHLGIADDDLRRLVAALPERISVPASFRWRDQVFEKVTVRFKGNSSSAPTQRHKRSFLVKFDDDRRFLGLRQVSLDNAIQFGSLFSEPLITGMLRDLGIPTHRCNHARLFLNGKRHGVYVNVERIDKTFVERRLPDPTGLLFKVDEGGPGANLEYLGDDPAAYQKTFEPETASAKREPRRLIEFLGLIRQTSPADFEKMLDARLEVDDFLKTMAVMLFAGAFDQLTGWNPHNYFLYCDTKKNRWRYLPWDLDVGFCEVAFGQIRVLDDWNAAWPVAGDVPNPLVEGIVANPALRERYRQIARVILEKQFAPDRLCAALDAQYARIKEDLKDDPFPPRRVTNPEDHGYDDIVASMKRFFRRRYDTARQQLDAPGPQPARRPRPPGPPPRFVAKLQRIQKAAERMQRAGKDVAPIQRLMEQVGPLLQQGRFDEAEKRIDEALRLTDEGKKP